ncbi:Hexokinase [Teladorsagia circumcincta]|uniref:Phosphotransferase n=1 Tax=Teladorsagia circumcincta TaxID=45464 RepID=A0A2G9TXT3_TELCI|nr:Hexokinase [Teladorsagia circumcincta]
MGMRLESAEVQEVTFAGFTENIAKDSTFQILKQFIISDDDLHVISCKIEAEMKAGLASVDGSSIAMLPSYVPALPDGSEEGKYVAIDLSGKNLRIMLLTLNGAGREPAAVNNNYIVPNHVMKGTGDQVSKALSNA